MNIPKKLKIGGHEFLIKLEHNSKLGDGSCGLCDRDTNTIIINADLHKSQQEATLIHEIFHAMNWELEEEILESLAQQLYQVFKDNNLLR
jgi:Zn-dependent peptidase ImmA (M78 family)